MAKQEINGRSIEEILWQACDKLRGSEEPSDAITKKQRKIKPYK